MITLILLSFFIALVIFAIIMFCLNKSHTDLQDNIEQHRRKWTGVFVFAALLLIMTMTGINSFMNTRT